MLEACPSHPSSTLPLQRCVRCGGGFCPDCLVPFRGGLYDAACKDAQLRDLAARTVRSGPDTLWRRAVAIGVDGLIIYGLLRLAYATFLPSVTQRLLGEHPSTSAVIAIVWTPLSLLVLLYDGFLLSSFGGATL